MKTVGNDLYAVRCTWMRGGTSKAAFFHASDLPTDPVQRDQLLLAAMGTDALQRDGIGGGQPLTTKIAIISPSAQPEADVDYLFGQVVLGEHRIDYSPTCGNILSAVAPFAIEAGLVDIAGEETAVRIYMVNTKSFCVAKVNTAQQRVNYLGVTAISGVPGTGAAVELVFSDVAGSSCGSLYPTGNHLDEFDGVGVTCIDNGMPVVVMKAADLGVSGYETPAALDANALLKSRIESIRLQAGAKMKLGDVTNKVVPKMTLIAAAKEGGVISTRTFIPKKCHDAIGVLGAASVATACHHEGTICAEFLQSNSSDGNGVYSIEHPTGEFTIRIIDQPNQPMQVALIRTARPLFTGSVLIPKND